MILRLNGFRCAINGACMRSPLKLRLLITQLAILAAFALMPFWYRLPARPEIFPPLYVSRFSLLLPLLLAIGTWLLTGLPGFAALRRSDAWRRSWVLALLGLALWGLLSTNWAFVRFRDPSAGETAALQFGIVALFAVVVASAAPPVRVIVAVLALGLVPNALVTLAQAANQGALGLASLGEFPFHASWEGVSILRAGNLTYVRPYGLMPHPNATAGMLMIGVVASAVWLFHPRVLIRVGAAVLCVLGLAALLLTFSRAAWLGLASGGLFLLLGLWRTLFGERWTIARKVRFTRPMHHENAGVTVPLPPPAARRALFATLALAAVLTLAVGGWFFAQYRPFLAARVGQGEESIELRSVADRIVFTDFALRSIRERPILGVGIGNFPWRASYYIAETFYDLRGDNVHHVFLSAWAELGTVGLALLVVALVCGVAAAVRLQFPNPAVPLPSAFKERTSPYRVALLAIVGALVVVGLFDHYPWTMLHFQVAWWGSLAGALHGGLQDRL
jgi:hypothetical protein